MSISLPSDDEILVKAPDGSWKVFRGGRLVDRDRDKNVAPPMLSDRHAEFDSASSSSFVRSALSAAIAPPPERLPVVEERTVMPPVPSVSAPQRPRVMDVIPPKELVGPVQELRMSLADFRALAPTVAERIKRIEEKLVLLEQEGYAKKLEGIAMWRASEVYDCYVRLGQESIAKGEAVPATIARKAAAGESTLTLEEFKAVTELNRALRF